MTATIRNALLTCITLLCVSILWSADAEKQRHDIISAILDHNSLAGLGPSAPPDTAENIEQLYGIIDGGAEVYEQHHFKHALIQDLTRTSDKSSFSLEIYFMETAENARALFAEKAGSDGTKAAFGDEGRCMEYYCMFVQNDCYVSIASSVRPQEGDSTLIYLGTAVAEVLKESRNN